MKPEEDVKGSGNNDEAYIKLEYQLRHLLVNIHSGVYSSGDARAQLEEIEKEIVELNDSKLREELEKMAGEVELELSTAVLHNILELDQKRQLIAVDGSDIPHDLKLYRNRNGNLNWMYTNPEPSVAPNIIDHDPLRGQIVK